MTNKGWWVSVPGSEGSALDLEQAWFFNLVFYGGTGWQVANEIVKPKVSINSNNWLQSALQKTNRKWKFATV